jgi:hypothetical protein
MTNIMLPHGVGGATPERPTSDNAPWPARVEGNGIADKRDCAASGLDGKPDDAGRDTGGARSPGSADRKTWLTLQARATRAGFVAHLTEGDDGRPILIVSRWASTTSFNDVDAAEAWLARVGGKAP